MSISMNSRISSAQRNLRDYIKHNDHREYMKYIDHRDDDSISVSSHSRTGSVTGSAQPAPVVHRDQRERDIPSQYPLTAELDPLEITEEWSNCGM